MKRTPHVRLILWAAPLLASTAVSPSAAQDEQTQVPGEKVECIGKAESAQRLRLAAKLLDARTELLQCVRNSCPSLVRSDCAHWLSEVTSAIPTIVVRAKDSSDKEVLDASLVVDGRKVADRLTDKPLELDPGQHTLELGRAGKSEVVNIRLDPGEKGHPVTVRLDQAPSAVAPSPGQAAVSPGGAPSGHASSFNYPAWISAGVTALALGSFAYFGATGKVQLDSLHESCGADCAQSDIQSAWNRLVVADVSLAVGVVAAGTAAWFFLNPPGAGASPPAVGSGPGLAPGAHGLALTWKGSF